MKKILTGIFACLFALTAFSLQAREKSPNIIIILADDLGWGDLSCFGSPTIHTRYLDQMAAEGMKFTQFYAAASICTPSRAGLLTGRMPIRSGMNSSPTHNVLYPTSTGGLPLDEVTIAKALKQKNYTTGIVGKWHLGFLPKYMPNNHGFDYYYGLPYSNDMFPKKGNDYPPLAIYRNTEIIEANPDQHLITQKYTVEAVNFIKQNKDKPFFLYYASNAPHVPLYASKDFAGKSKRGLFGDVVEELDWSIGQVLQTLRDLKIDKNTLVIFSSDNGPWLIKDEDGGSAGQLSGGKGSPYEGGYRVPGIAWWPGTIKPNQISYDVVGSLDFFPTAMALAGIDLVKGKAYDGHNIVPLLTQKRASNQDMICYYTREKLCAIRKGLWKAVFLSSEIYGKKPVVEHETPLLYNLEIDPSERFDVAKQNPGIVMEMKALYKTQLETVKPQKFQLDN